MSARPAAAVNQIDTRGSAAAHCAEVAPLGPARPRPRTVASADITVLIPTLNEELTIGHLLEQLQSEYEGIHIIVADDASGDSTGLIVRNFAAQLPPGRVRLIERKAARVRGITASILEALPMVTTPYCMVMDGDLQHPPAVVAEFIASFGRGADLVVASRRPQSLQQPLHRKVCTITATLAAVRALRRRGWRIADPLSGLFGASTDIFRNAARQHAGRFEPAGYKILFDLLRCLDSNAQRHEEIFYHFGSRSGGSSKLRPIHAFYFIRSLLR